MAKYIERELKPFGVPNYVVEVTDEGCEGAAHPLCEVDEITLAEMCFGYIESIFKKAGKIIPFSLKYNVKKK